MSDDLDWRTLCYQLNQKSLTQLQTMARKYNLPYEGKTREELAKHLCIQREASRIPNLNTCPRQSITGIDLHATDPYHVIQDVNGQCYTLDDLIHVSNTSHTINFQNDLTLQKAIQLLTHRCNQLEKDADGCRSVRHSLRPPKSQKYDEPLKLLATLINEVQDHPELSRLVTESKIKSMTDKQIDNINDIIMTYDQVHMTILLPLVENKTDHDYYQGLINIIYYIKNSEGSFEIEKLKTQIARIINA
jgi:hypothetical protein